MPPFGTAWSLLPHIRRKNADITFEQERNTVVSESMISICNSVGKSPMCLIAIQVIATFALMRFADWRSKVEEARRGSSIRELEALFALEDPRESRPRERMRVRKVSRLT